MNIKKIIASAAAAVTTISALTTGFAGIRNVPVNRTAPSANELNEATLEASDSIGKYIKGLTDDTGKSSQPAGMTASAADINCSVTDLTFDPETFIATAETTQSASCRLKVTLTDDITGIEAASGEFPLTAGENTISEVKLPVLALPDYYLVTAVIVSNSGVPLSAPFNFKEYTKEMQEIRALTVYDFEEDRVVNLDENTDTNFVVLSDDTIMPESSDTVNTVVSADFDTNTFVFDNVDETLSGVEKGQPLYVRMDDGASIAVEVVDVKEDDGRLTITGSDEKAEEMFDIIKIETVAGTEDCEYEPAEGSELLPDDITMLPMSAAGADAQVLSDETIENGATLEVPIKYENKDETFSVGGKFSVAITTELNIYKKFLYVNCEFKVKTPTKVSAEISVKSGGGVNEKRIPMLHVVAAPPVPVVLVGFEIGLELSAEVKATIEKALKPEFGFRYDSDTKQVESFRKDSSKKSETKIEIEGSIFFGIYIKASFHFLSQHVFEASAEFKVGLEITGKLSAVLDSEGEFTSDVIIVPNTTTDFIHGCGSCVDGDINLVIELGGKLSLFDTFESKITIAKYTNKLGDWYYSDKLGFGFGECPNIAYRLEVNVKDAEEGMIVGIDDNEIYLYEGQPAVCYCHNGDHDIAVYDKDGKTAYARTINIDGKKRTLNVTSGSSGGGGGGGGGSAWGDDYKPETTTTTVQTLISYVSTTTATSPYDILDAGKFDFGAEYSNAEIDYFYYRNGELHLYCKGDLPDGYLLNNKVESSICGYIDKGGWDAKSVYIENLDEISPITYIPKYFLNGMEYLEEIYLPDTVAEIREEAFIDCKSLKYIHLPDSLRTIGDHAFYRCYALESLEFPENLETIGEEAFVACTSLKEIVIPANTKVISDGAFHGCSSLESVSLPEGLKNIGTESDEFGVFGGCINLRKINVPDGAELGICAFYGCTSLESVNIPKNGNILYCTFIDCTSLKSVEIPSNITTIDRAFDGCTSLSELKLPGSVKHFSCGDDSGLEKIYVLNPDAEIEIGKYTNKSPTIYGYMNSTAYYYAKSNSLKFVSLGEYSIKGDVNGDNVVDTFDLLIMRNAYNRNYDKELYDPIEVDMLTYDIDSDGYFDANDMILLSDFLLGKVKRFI